MIKKLRIKFIVISMISILIVLFVIICGINISNYVSVSNNADNILKTLYENGGRFKKRDRFPDSGEEYEPTETEVETEDDRYENMDKNPEMPYETRFFTVLIKTDEDNNKTYDVIMDFIKAVETKEEAINYANKVLARDNNKGYVGVYRYLHETNDEGTIVIFVDCRRGLDNASNFLKSSLIISIVGYICVFALIVLASKYVFKPVDEAYQKQKRFISNASHELKTPLTIISANNEIIEMIHGEDESTDAINRQVKRLNQMVTSLSLLTKLSEIKKLDKTSIFNLSDAINDVIADTNILNYDDKKIELKIDSNISFNGEEGLIRQLVSIILDNAIKYSNTYVNINLYNNGKNIIFETINDCYQIDDGYHNEVFERFYRSDNIRSKTEGSGIGLSIAKEIVDLHKGKILANSINNNFKIEVIL